jgi:soluble lytic murein transglycosylase-like protein
MRALGRTLAGLLGALAFGAAHASVIEIAPNGVARTYDAPMLFLAEGAQPLTPAPAPAPSVGRPAQPPAALRAPGRIAPYVAAAAARHGLEPALVDAVAHHESRFRPDAVSPKGAIGVMQLMPATAAALGVNPWDVGQNIDGGARYLRAMLDRFGGDVALALAAYNAGPGAVERHRGVPPFAETRTYVARISADLAARGVRAGLRSTPQ